MKVRYTNLPEQWVTVQMIDLGYTKNSRFGGIQIGGLYEVYAITVWAGIANLLLLDDYRSFVLVPTVAFEIVDRNIPDDWEVGLFDHEVTLIAGPPFLSRDITAYEKLVESDPALLQQLWTWIVAAEKESSDQ